MGRAIINFSNRAAKNRARVRKCRFLKQKRKLHENHIRERIYSIKEAHIEGICDNIEQRTIDNEEEDEKAGDNMDRMMEFTEKLRFWAMHHRITHCAISDLLVILIFGGFNFLPRNSRTFMGTPTKIDITAVTNGKMWYYSVEKCLQNAISTIRSSITATLDFSFDGLPIFKSSNTQFWPLLFSIQGIFMIHIMCIYQTFIRMIRSYTIFVRISETSSNGLWYLGWRIETSLE